MARNLRKGHRTLTVLIKQRFDKDCALCCLAMILGISYEEAYEAQGDLGDLLRTRGPYGKEFVNLFANLGLVPDIEYKTLFLLPEYCNDTFLQNALWGRPALIEVRSKNYGKSGEKHIVYWDGRELFDPSNKRTYQNLDECEPIYLYLFDRTATDKAVAEFRQHRQDVKQGKLPI